MRRHFPVWFRVAVVLIFSALLVPYFLLRGGDASEARIASVLARASDLIPVLRTQAMRSRSIAEPDRGSYRLNGMLVWFQTYPISRGAGNPLGGFERAFEAAGYKYRTFTVQGHPTLVAIHPETKMMLTARFGNLRNGWSTVRLSQQNLSQLDPSFRAEVPGVPAYPDATHKMLIESTEGRKSKSLSYESRSSADWIQRYYEQEMPGRGWARLVPPVDPRQAGLSVLFFEKGGEECSVVVSTDPEGGGSIVLATLSSRQEGST